MHPYPTVPAGSRVALVAPAGPLKIPNDIDRALENCRMLGWEPVVGEHARQKFSYFAGHDDERLHDLNHALRDDGIDAIWCMRGGYGAMRLLDGLDYESLRRRPKALIGYSDITAFHCAVQACCELSSLHGPTARGTLTPFAERSLRAAVTGADSCAGKSLPPVISTSMSYSPMRKRSPCASACGRSGPSASSEPLTKTSRSGTRSSPTLRTPTRWAW